ncbi:MAG: carbamate kinase [Eubacteriales bacterium]|jgi:carbamate kinase
MAKIVIALGGNALGDTPAEQLKLVADAAVSIVDIIQEGHDVIVSHGNGPQVGMINMAFTASAESGAVKSDMPFPECGAMSQGYIGYHLQNAIQNELHQRGIDRPVATILTQVLVSENDKAFSSPTKPIGTFFSKSEAEVIMKERGYTMVEDAGRGWRRVVPSPRPIDVIEKEAITALFNSGSVVITVGGGGIPVLSRDGKLVGIPAVIDKDFASAKLAELVEADILVILTAVDRVAINWGSPEQKFLGSMTVEQAKAYAAEGHFAPGSMLPKVQAAIDFVESGPGKKAIITSLNKASEALDHKSGTAIF